MARIGDLVMGVVVETQKANRSMRQVRKEMSLTSKVARGMAGTFANMTTAITGFTVAIGSAVLFSAINRTASELDELAKTGARLSLATETLSGLNFVAGLYGVTTDELTRSLVRQNKAVADANRGLSTQVEAFNDLNIEISELQGLTTDQILYRISQGIKSVRNETDQLRIAQDIFGRSGFKLLPLLRAERGELQALAAEARRLGFAFDEEGLARVEAYNDALLKLRSTLGGAFQQFVIDISPAATSTVNVLQSILEGARAMNAPSPSEIAATMVPGLPELMDRAMTSPDIVGPTPRVLEQLEANRQQRATRAMRDRVRQEMDAEKARRDMFRIMEEELRRVQEVDLAVEGVISGMGQLTNIVSQQIEERRRQVQEEQQLRRLSIANRIAQRYLLQNTGPMPLAPNVQAGTAAGINALLRNFQPQAPTRSIEEISQDILSEDQERNTLLERILASLKDNELPA